jgi:oligopeptide/dipeptide ABC transporter ATP-binding protein
MVELPGWMSRSYPHELSGGQARRVGIARALALQPDLIIADEPTAGLDASATSSILNLLEKLRSTNGTAYLVITHALNVVGHLADRIAVMYLGRIVETGPAEAILDDPRHPYTQALMAAIPSTDPERRRERVLLEGEIPSPRNPPAGCHFHPRCPHAAAVCREAGPVLGEVYPGHWAACHRLADLASPAGTRGGPGHAETGAGHGDAGAGKEADSGC